MNSLSKNQFLVLILWFIIYSLTGSTAFGQVSKVRVLTVDELFTLAEQNAASLSVSRQNIAASQQRTEIARSARLPDITASVDAGYIGNITVLNPSFSYNETVPVPHFTNNYNIEAGEILYKGNSIKNNIVKAQLQEELSKLNYDEDRQTIKLLMLGEYFNLYRLLNQKKVYASNIALAKARLKNITGLQKEGMVTRNDITRSELQITELNVLADQINNNIAIINKELTVVLGLPESTMISVDTTLTGTMPESITYAEYLSKAYASKPSMKANPINAAIADKNVSLAKAEKLPTVSLYAGEGLSRPYLYALPPLDIYYNVYQAGIRVQYNVSSLYHAKHNIRLAEIGKLQQASRAEYVKQQTELDVNSAFIKFNEAKTELDRREKAKALADDNYRIVEKKYLNQLALLNDILDASTAKLSAELNQTNATVDIVYKWYQLQKATGNF